MTTPQSAAALSDTRLARLQSYAEQDPNNLQLLAELADAALDASQFSLARDAIDRALTLQPNDPFFRFRLSSVALAESKLDEALQITEALLAEGFDDPAIRFNHAYALVLLNKYEEATPVLEWLFAEQAPFPNVVRLLIRSLHYQGQLDKAIDVAKAHLAAHPDDNQVVGMLSLLYFDNNDLPQAAQWSKKALESGYETIDALLAASGTALGAEEPERARQLSERAIAKQPHNGRAWVNLGLVDMLNGNLPGAEESLAKAVHYMPGHIGSWIALGWAQLMQSKLDAAQRSFQTALELDDTFAESHSGLAAVAAMRGDMAAAEVSAKTARRLDSSAISSYYPELVKLYQQSKPEEAQRLMQGALKRSVAPNGGNMMDMIKRLAATKSRTKP